MTRRLLLVAVATIGVLAYTATADALTLQRANGNPIPRLQHLINHAPVPFAPGIVTIRYNGRGTTSYTDDRVIHVGRGGLPEDTLMHELGHDYDRHMLTDAGFTTWQTWVGQTRSRDLVSQIYAPDSEDPGGRWMEREFFADWYAGCATRGASVWALPGRRLVTGYGLVLTERRFRSSCRRVWRLPALFDPTVL
jgi:hypothetical protein